MMIELARARLGLAAAAAIASLLAGCAADDDATAVPDDDAPTISRTVVQLHPDGTQTVTEDMISPAEQRAEKAARESGKVARITSDVCGTHGFMMFDGPGQQGNELCFEGTGLANLHDYKGYKCTPRGFCYLIDWHDRVQSFYTGDYHGYYEIDSIFGRLRVASFHAGEWHPNTDAGGPQRSDYVELGWVPF